MSREVGGSSGHLPWMQLVLLLSARDQVTTTVCYVDFLGDGDSKSHKVLVDEAVNGEVQVTKLECVAHFQKPFEKENRSPRKRKRSRWTGKANRQDYRQHSSIIEKPSWVTLPTSNQWRKQ